MAVVTDYTALISDYSWNGDQTGAPVFVSYAFLMDTEVPSLSDYQPYANNGYSAFTAAQQASFRQAADIFEASAGIILIEVDNPDDAMISVMSTTGSSFGGWANYGSANTGYTSNGRLVVENTGTNYAPGTYEFEVILHELGHTFGLKHPFEDDPILDPAIDNENNTIMSYTSNFINDTNIKHLDLDALKYLYGDGFTNTPAWNWSDTTRTFTLTGTGLDDTLLALDTDAVVTGMAGNDLIWGRDGDDNLDGGADDDEIHAGSGNDIVRGGAGNDAIFAIYGSNTVVYDLELTPENYGIVRTADSEFIITARTGDEGTDTVSGYTDYRFGGTDWSWGQIWQIAREASDDYAGSAFTTGVVSVGADATGMIEDDVYDIDWFAFEPLAGHYYGVEIDFMPLTGQAFGSSQFLSTNIVDEDGQGSTDDTTLAIEDTYRSYVFNSSSDEKAYIKIASNVAGSYTVSVTDFGMSVSMPTVSIPGEVLVTVGGTVALSDYLTVSDPDGDPITAYQVYDSTGVNNAGLNGAVQQGDSYFASNDLDAFTLAGDDVPSSQNLSVRVSDGSGWSNWNNFTLTTIIATNTAPVAAVDDQTIGLDQNAWKRLDSVLSVSDADGDAITHYEVWDSIGGDNWWADGGIVDASGGYTTNDLSDMWFRRDDEVSTQTLWVRANDGTEWGAWDRFELTTAAGNTAPVAAVDDQTIGLDQNAWKRLDSVLSVSDADGDAITQYEVWDSIGGDNWWADGGIVDASGGYITNDLSDVWFRRDDEVSTQTLWVRAYDNQEWSVWESFNLTTA